MVILLTSGTFEYLPKGSSLTRVGEWSESPGTCLRSIFCPVVQKLSPKTGISQKQLSPFLMKVSKALICSRQQATPPPLSTLSEMLFSSRAQCHHVSSEKPSVART
ncbi:hypothetical protein U0070_008623 [Myodes glareolus]|uniref:Uncharacterized protein n=1 Tax=Myodes glareolus TaxID=447135 RepID=A0AAW0JHC9_MYOGA